MSLNNFMLLTSLNSESKMGAIHRISPINLRFYSSQDYSSTNAASTI